GAELPAPVGGDDVEVRIEVLERAPEHGDGGEARRAIAGVVREGPARSARSGPGDPREGAAVLVERERHLGRDAGAEIGVERLRRRRELLGRERDAGDRAAALAAVGALPGELHA